VFSLFELCARTDPHSVPRLTWEALVKAGAFDYTGHNRGALFAALDTAMTESQRAAEDRRSGQGALFGLDAGPDPEQAADGVDDRHSWSKSETLSAEHEVLGFYHSGHPLEERAGLFEVLSTAKSTDIAARPAGGEVVIAGLIVALSETVVKSGTYAGRKMARFRLEDLSGGVNVTVFPRTFDAFRPLLVDNSVIVCRGKVEDRGDEPGLILDQVSDIDAALRQFEGGVVVQLRPEDGPVLSRLRETIGRHTGKSPLFFRVTGDDGCSRTVRTSSDTQVAISSELATEVDQLLGRGRMRLARF
jgi:DNA polymerase-3 subunit alpha